MKPVLVALALAALAPALSAAGVVVKQGDVLFIWNQGLVHFDPGTGNRQVISGCPGPDTDCSNNPGLIIGTGPMWSGGNSTPPLAQPDGSILVIRGEDGLPYDGTAAAFRVDPANGQRTIIARADDGKGFPLFADVSYGVVPSFPPQLAAFPVWGLPALLGLFLGVAVRRRPRA